MPHRPSADRRPLRAARAAAAALALLLAALAPAGGALAGAAGAIPAFSPPGAAGPGGGGALRVTASPPRLVLGTDGSAELRIDAPDEVQELNLTVTAGRIEGLRRLPSGGFTARYRPPAERHPQVAIVAAAASPGSGLLDGWLAIPLDGQGDARVPAPPGAEVTLQVADRSFGPRRAGADGVAVVPVIVPPGVREAHQGFKPIDLRVPETSLLYAALDRTALLADRVERVRVIAYVVAPHGAARRGDEPLFEPSRGSVTVRAREPGAFEAIWSVPPGPAGEERLAVSLPGSAVSRRVLRVRSSPGQPAAVAIAFDREVVVAGEAEAVTVTARALDAAGNPVAAELEIGADGGVVTSAVDRAPGVREARVVLGPRFGGRRALVVTASSPGGGVAAERVLPLRPAAPVVARLQSDDVLFADGAREARLRVSVLDRYDNEITVAPRVTAARGRVAAVEPDAAGGYAIRYVGPRVDGREADRLAFDVLGLEAEAPVLLAPPRGPLGAVLTVGGFSDVRGRFAGARTGLALEREGVRQDRPGSPAQPAVGDLVLSARLEVELGGYGGLRVARGPSRGQDAFGLAATLLAGVAAARELRAGPTLFASATAGVHFARVDPAAAPPTSGFAPAGRLGLGVGWRRRSRMPFLEASILAAGPARAGAFAALALSAGLRFDLETSDGDPAHRR